MSFQAHDNFRYSAAKRELLANQSLGLQDGMPTHFLASLLAGTVATTACAPADVLKSRVQNAMMVGGVRPVSQRCNKLFRTFADTPFRASPRS